MKVNLYTVRDKTAEQCGPVFQAINHGVACRSVVRMFEKIPKYDWDAFVLWWIGVYDDESAVIEGMSPEVVDVNIPRFEDVVQRKFGFVEEQNV